MTITQYTKLDETMYQAVLENGLTVKIVPRPGFSRKMAYFVTDFCGVVVLREEFTLEEGLAERSLEKYITNVIANNGYTDIAPQNKDGLWFYERTSDSSYAQSYCYKGSDSFWIVQFLCSPSDVQILEDVFYLWAQSVEVK